MNLFLLDAAKAPSEAGVLARREAMAVVAANDRQKNPRTAAGELGTSFAVLLLEFGGAG